MENLALYHDIVEEAIQKLGVNAGDCRDAKPGRWMLVKGSVEVVVQVYINPESDVAYCRVHTAVMPVPTQNVCEFYKELLSINMEYAGITFGVRGETAYLKAEREAEGLDVSEMSMMIQRIGVLADHYDDILKKKYGVA